MFIFKRFWAVIALIISLGISSSNKDFNQDLHAFLIENNTSSFLVSQKGDLIINEEFKIEKNLRPKNLMFFNLFQHGFVKNRSQEDVASIQKSLISILIGIAQQKGFLDINQSITSHIGQWTKLTKEKEDLITIQNLLTMTSGLDVDFNYSSEPGSEWLYNTRVYSRLINVLEQATGLQINVLSSEWLFKPLQMTDTFWKERKKGPLGFQKDSSKYGLITTGEDLLKFGEFILNGGEVGDNHIISDIDFFDDSFTKSQNLNEAYGYLWWLNNSKTHMTWNKGYSSGQLFPNAPEDTILALGAGSRILAIIPSKEMVMVRLGSFPNNSNFNNSLWKYIQN
jgi:CubicO group peptidase (beta-lactamase class C family)